ncbi:MAG: nucleoside deaminase [Bryobacteraceae bacterium]
MNPVFMNRAIELAVANVNSGKGGPFASVVVKDGKVVGEGTNLVTSTNDPTAHAEVVAIRAACAALGAFQLDGCDLYTTCEPCPMCLGAIYWARPERIFFGATAIDAANAGFSDEFIYEQINVEHGQRQIPFVPMMREATLVCFEAWRAKADRVDY